MLQTTQTGCYCRYSVPYLHQRKYDLEWLRTCLTLSPEGLFLSNTEQSCLRLLPRLSSCCLQEYFVPMESSSKPVLVSEMTWLPRAMCSGTEPPPVARVWEGWRSGRYRTREWSKEGNLSPSKKSTFNLERYLNSYFY